MHLEHQKMIAQLLLDECGSKCLLIIFLKICENAHSALFLSFFNPQKCVRSHNFGLNMSDRIDLIYSVEPYAFRASEDNSPTLI
jgi:hypothetical protein